MDVKQIELRKALENNERAVSSIHKDMAECVINWQETSAQFLKNYFEHNGDYIDDNLMAEMRCHYEQLDDLMNKLYMKRSRGTEICKLLKS